MVKVYSIKTDQSFQKHLLFVNGCIPAALLLWDALNKNLGSNPIEFATRATGVLALVFLLLSLCVTPLRQVFNLNWIFKHRRTLGLFSFFYACLHLLTYIVFDRDFGFTSIPADIYKRPFIAIGMACFLMMVPLAVTSTQSMIKRLGGARWIRLHRLTYVIAVGGVVHYYMIVKSDTRYPLYFGAAVVALLGYRFLMRPKKRAQTEV